MEKIQQNGQGFYYVITWRVEDPMQPQSTSHTIRVSDPTSWHYEVTDITAHPYTYVAVSVKAGNSFGEATMEPTTVIGYTGEDGE